MFKKSMLRTALWLIFHILALLCLTAGVSGAYLIHTTDNGNPIKWPNKTNFPVVNYLVNENCAHCSGEAAAVQMAGRTWSNAGAQFSFAYGGTTTTVGGSYDGSNCISWSTTDFSPGSTTLAETTYWYDPDTGEILECDCVFNDYNIWSTAATTPYNQFDIESVMLHEFGHYLSLGHAVPPAIMQPTIPDGTQRRILTTDDKAGIIAIYGARPSNKIVPSLLLLLLE